MSQEREILERNGIALEVEVEWGVIKLALIILQIRKDKNSRGETNSPLAIHRH